MRGAEERGSTGRGLLSLVTSPGHGMGHGSVGATWSPLAIVTQSKGRDPGRPPQAPSSTPGLPEDQSRDHVAALPGATPDWTRTRQRTRAPPQRPAHAARQQSGRFARAQPARARGRSWEPSPARGGREGGPGMWSILIFLGKAPLHCSVPAPGAPPCWPLGPVRCASTAQPPRPPSPALPRHLPAQTPCPG